LPHGLGLVSIISLTISRSIPFIRAQLTRQKSRVVALVTDLFGTDLFDLGKELGIPTYLYYTSTAMCLLFVFHFPRLDETVSCDFQDMPDPVCLPGCVPIHGKDFFESAHNRQSEGYSMVLQHIKKYGLADGIFVNTFFDLEPGAIRGLQTEDPNRPPVYPVGPIIRSGLDPDDDNYECLRWLDRQPTASVLFVSFGSRGSLSNEQCHELAVGLERSGQRFLWVVRGTNGTHDEEDPFKFLPYGYLDRIKERGLLVPSWAPQIKVLSHGSTGGFLTHCGWNSILESMVHGVPVIAWPLGAEQKMNALMLDEGLRVALRPKVGEDGLVEADEIAKVVNDLMEGEEGKNVGRQMKELCKLAKKAISEDGDSTMLLQEVALKFELKKNKNHGESKHIQSVNQ